MASTKTIKRDTHLPSRTPGYSIRQETEVQQTLDEHDVVISEKSGACSYFSIAPDKTENPTPHVTLEEVEQAIKKEDDETKAALTKKTGRDHRPR